MPRRPTPNVESPRTSFVPYKSHTSVQMNELMKIHMPNLDPMKGLTLNAPTNNFGRYFSVKMNSWDIEGLSIKLTKNTYGPCASFLLRQMYEEKKIRWDN